MTEETITLVHAKTLMPLFGAKDQHVKRIRDAFSVDITHRDGQIRVAGPTEAVARATELLKQLKDLVETQGEASEDDVTRLLRQTGSEQPAAANTTTLVN